MNHFDGSGEFTRTWDEYKTGFGDAGGEAWLGHEYLHYLTSTRSYKLRFDLEDWDGNTAYAEYASFVVTSESDNYRLLLGAYSGTASADANTDQINGFLYNNNAEFSTYDRDNDNRGVENCAADREGYGGFWHNSCTNVGATTAYCPSAFCASIYKMHWNAFAGYAGLKTLTMMMRPV